MPAPDLSKFLLTPPRRGDHDGAYRWQWLISLKVWALLVFCLWGAGAFATFGLNGFARAEDVQSLKTEVREARLENIERVIFDLWVRKCSTADLSLRRALTDQLTKQLRLYREVGGIDYPHKTTTCEDLN